MKGFRKKLPFLCAAGFLAGTAIGALVLFFSVPGAYDGGWSAGKILRHLLLSGLYGIVPMGATVIYEIERWGVLRVTLTHLAITMGAFHAFGLPLGWFVPGDAGYFTMMAAMLFAYFVIWLAMYLAGRHRVRETNRELQKWKGRSRKGSGEKS